jgi:hypothetical protein
MGNGVDNNYKKGQVVGAAYTGAAVLPSQADLTTFGVACAGLVGARGSNGGNWVAGGYAQTVFNTVAPPNWMYPNCSYADTGGYANDRPGLYAARSYHPGGANHTMGDASVRFIAETVDLKTYQYVGSRAGGETVSSF